MAQYPSLLAVSDTGQVLPLASGQIYDIDDFTAARPLQITDLNGTPIAGSVLQSAPNGVLPRFRENSTRTVVSWVSGPHRMDIPCLDMVPPGGRAGQVLVLGQSGTFVWADNVAGGGGTMVPAYETNGRYTRPTTDPNICVIFTGVSDPGSVAKENDRWERLS